MLRKTVASQEEHLRATNIGMLVGMNNLGWILSCRGDYVAAEETLWRTLKLKREAVGESHPQVMTTMSVLVDVLEEQQKHSESKNLQRRMDELRNEREEELEKRREQQREEGGKRGEGGEGRGAIYKAVDIREQQPLRGYHKSYKTNYLSHVPDKDS